MHRLVPKFHAFNSPMTYGEELESDRGLGGLGLVRSLSENDTNENHRMKGLSLRQNLPRVKFSLSILIH